MAIFKRFTKSSAPILNLEHSVAKLQVNAVVSFMHQWPSSKDSQKVGTIKLLKMSWYTGMSSNVLELSFVTTEPTGCWFSLHTMCLCIHSPQAVILDHHVVVELLF